MQRMLVMTILGADRPGLVESVAAIVAEHGGNWLESRMSRLGGLFAGILRVSVPDPRNAQLVKALDTLKTRGLSVTVHSDESLTKPEPRQLRRLTVVGQDRPGIVRQIAQA